MLKQSIAFMASFAMMTAVTITTATYSDDAEARRGSFSSSSSRSSFSSRSSTSRVSSWSSSSKKVPATNASKPTYGKTPATSSSSSTPKKVAKQTYVKPKPKFGATVKTKQKVAASRTSYKAQQAAFKPRPKVATQKVASTSRTTYSVKRSPVIARSTSYDRRTYYKRRSSYYNGWYTPSYAYNSYPTFGMWDAMALWFMLDHISQPNYQQMYYNQMNSQGMQEWRKEADKLAKDNAELRAKLNAMDKSAAQMAATGVKQDPSYLPPGVDADVLMSADVREATKPTIRMCTGHTDQNYYNVARILGAGSEYVNIEPVVTDGSAENLAKLDAGQCDGALVQRDAYWGHAEQNPTTKLDYERVMSPYSEVVHMICRKDSDVEYISDLDSEHTVMVGIKGSGTQLTWGNMTKLHDNLEDVKTLNLDGAKAKSRLASGEADCMLSISGLNTKFMRDINTLAKRSELRMVDWDEKDLLETVDPAGKPVYESYTLPHKTYPNLNQDSWFGSDWAADKYTVTVPADLIVSNDWIKKNKGAYEGFVSEAVNKTNTIHRYVGNQ